MFVIETYVLYNLYVGFGIFIFLNFICIICNFHKLFSDTFYWNFCVYRLLLHVLLNWIEELHLKANINVLFNDERVIASSI